MADPQEHGESDTLSFLIRNPSRNQDTDFRLAVPAGGSVRDVKLALQQQYPGAPHPDAITVSGSGSGLLAALCKPRVSPGDTVLRCRSSMPAGCSSRTARRSRPSSHRCVLRAWRRRAAGRPARSLLQQEGRKEL